MSAYRNIQNLQTSLKFGSSESYFEIEVDGSITYKGDSTVWDDIVGSLIGQRLYSNAGTVDYNYEENCVVFQPGGDITDLADCLVFNYQYPHKAKDTGYLNLHFHWEQESTTNREITVWYRIQSNNNLKTEDWTEVIINTNDNNIFEYSSGTLNQISALASIDMTGAGISATVQFRMTRSDSNSGNINVTFVDAHYEIDGPGSRQEYVK
jgi:hypothetical protein